MAATTAIRNTIKKLDHINILSTKLPETIRFYEKFLGVTATIPPGDNNLSKGAWFTDDRGIAIIHVVTAPFDPFQTGTAPTGEVGTVVNHFAVEGTNFDELLEMMRRDGLAVRTLDVPFLGQRFIFFHDPNGVLIEVNFRIPTTDPA